MRPTSSTWRLALRYTHPIVTIVESWLDGVKLAAVPITAGDISYDDSGVIKRRVKLTVPTYTPDGRRWDPAGNPGAPLATYGQRLHVWTGIGYPNGATELMDHGWYLITGWKRDEDEETVEVEAEDLARLLVDAALYTPMSPPAGATYASELRRLVEPILPVVIPAGFLDPAISTSVVWERDRDKAISALCAAWPARWYVGDDGAVHVAAPYAAITQTSPTQVVLTDGTDGTVTARARQSERGAIFNAVVVKGKSGDAGQPVPYAVAEVTTAGHPVRVSGPYGRVVAFYESDLITTQPQADATAAALLVPMSSSGRVEPVKCVPDPSIELGDVIRVSTMDGDSYVGRVTKMTVPLTPDDAPATITPAAAPGGAL